MIEISANIQSQYLASLIKNGWHASEQEMRRIAKQILEILVYLHSQTPPVIHRAIKPENIVLKSPINSDKQKDWAVCLVDFESVQNTYYNTLMRESTVVETYGYIAPEQFLGQAVPATDLYGLGATLLYVLTHRSPAELPTNQLEIDFRSQIQISPEFGDWLENLLAPDLEKRFKSAKEALGMLFPARMFIAKVNRSKLCKSRLKEIVAVVTIAAFHYFQYPILNTIGFTPDAAVKAVKQGDAETVRHYLDSGFSATSRVNNRNLLYLAGSKEVAELLIAKGADVKGNDEFGFTPLHFAAAFGRIEIAQTLIAKGADINAQSKSDVDMRDPKSEYPFRDRILGITPLFLARSPEMAKFLIAKGADVNGKSKDGVTPLHTAQSKAIAQILLAAGAKINIKADNARFGQGTTLLHNAAKIGFKELVQQLINNGANVVIGDREKRTPLHYAATKEVAALLMRDINARDILGNTPLHLAVEDHRQEVVAFLIDNGAKVNVKNNDGKTPLDIAVDLKLQDLVALLIAKHPDVNTEDQDGRSLLHVAVSFKLKDVAEQLIAKGAFVNAKNNRLETPLHIAVSQGSQDIAELLIAKGARVNARNDAGQTPLYSAIAIGHNDLAVLLINRGADVNNIDKYGATPVHQAAGYGTVEILKLLIAKGATIDAKNYSGMTPLNLAEINSNPNQKAAAQILISRNAKY